MSAFLLEVLSEEIPAGRQGWGAATLAALLAARLQALGVAHDPPRSYATPRRLTVAFDGLPASVDRDEERKGPREGAPEKAIEGFARSAGVARTDLELRPIARGKAPAGDRGAARRPQRAWFATVRRPGSATADLLAEAAPAAMAAMPWPRSMRWGANEVRWVRPVLSILALFDGAVVPFRFGPVAAGAATRGHRVLAPEAFDVTGFEEYRQRLEAAFVLIDAGERRRRIARDAARLAAAEGLALAHPQGRPARCAQGGGEDGPCEELLAEVAGLVEWPLAMIGGFDPAFMALPGEVLATAMRRHQRYFPLRDATGALAPRFVFVADRAPAPGTGCGMHGEGAHPRGPKRSETGEAQQAAIERTVIAGNERVLAARLADARHFWDRDRERSLESRLPALADVLFHAGLGSVGDQAARLRRLAPRLARHIPGCDGALAERAARLAKADLASLMVGEFPELQGIMGGHYARHDGEEEAVARAIAEHYAPRGPAEACPTRPLSVAVALADKIDTLAGFFAIGRRPTGSRDPFALRRAALGIVRLALENRLRLPLAEVFAAACEGWRGIAGEETAAELAAFVAERLEVHLVEAGWQRGPVRAVLRGGGRRTAAEDDPARAAARLEALVAFLAGGDGASLLAARRRAANIVRIEERKDGRAFDGAFDDRLFERDEERALAAALAAAGERSRQALAGECFADAMAALAGLRAPLDAFFERVTVNAAPSAKDSPGEGTAGLRANRLRLLAAVAAAMDEVADFSAIEAGGAGSAREGRPRP